MFLTLEDPRARIQGSRDPLGVQPVWSAFGRRVVTNLTTVTGSVRGFTVLLLGRYIGERLVERGDADESDAIPVFLRVEQLCAYARHVCNEENDSRGIERVRRFLSEGRRVRIEDGPGGLIMSDQKTYGLWGLFIASSRVSGLVTDDPIGLTDLARAFVEREYVPGVDSQFDRIMAYARSGGELNATKSNPVLKSLALAMPPILSPRESTFYGEYLRDATAVNNNEYAANQRRLAAMLQSHCDLSEPISRHEIEVLEKASSEQAPALARSLRHIARLEAVLAVADVAFDLLLVRHGQGVASVARFFEDAWGSDVPHLEGPLDELMPTVKGHSSPEFASCLWRFDEALRAADYDSAIHTLLDWNREVMARRNALPWVELSSGTLDVKYRGTESELPSGDELEVLWRNSYFLNSLKDITRQIAEGG